MKSANGKTLKLNKSIISLMIIATILLVYNTGMPFTGIWDGALYKVKAEESSLMVEFYNSNRQEHTLIVAPNFLITNVGSSDIDLKDVKIRYYYTLDSYDSEETQNYGFYTSQKNGTNINATATFAKMGIPTDTADYYFEIGFDVSAGTLEPGDKLN
ncbi:cellulose binding domain-containing protein [Acetivibrio straminisolvens]|uniref:Endoglucanase n=1 Tax=Acetivibrio straminisolvens JCM 21531 TaxID=1294263 RepID=W4VAR9_9FIRM|nr:cellulose binding domain-containing protein [Acetivibrio straminisolvens]GAE90292.1 endoglucanase precursor [Acetivibrio straminisolvens JCM 21531]